MDTTGVTLHFDAPRDILVCNLGQQFAGWIAAAEPLAFEALRFRIDGEEIQPELGRREDVELAFPGQHCTGWYFLLPRRFSWRQSTRLLTVEAVLGERLLGSRTFLKSRALLAPTRDGPLYFMHIPKTAGTALRHVADYVFAGLPSLLVYGDWPGMELEKTLALPTVFRSSREIVFGHFDFNFTRAFADDAAPKVVTTVREPRELVRSYLAFNAQPVAAFLDNPLVRHFSGIGHLEPFGGITAEHLDIALQHLREHCHVVLQERLQDFADELAALFGRAPLSVGRANETPPRDDDGPAKLPADVRFDDVLYDACRDQARGFAAFLAA